MKRKLLLLVVFFGLLLSFGSCRMRDVSGTSYKIYNEPRRTNRHYGAKKNSWQRSSIWGRKHFGPRPYRHRGRYRQ